MKWLFETFGCFENDEVKTPSYTRRVSLMATFFVFGLTVYMAMKSITEPPFGKEFWLFICLAPYSINKVGKFLEAFKK